MDTLSIGSECTSQTAVVFGTNLLCIKVKQSMFDGCNKPFPSNIFNRFFTIKKMFALPPIKKKCRWSCEYRGIFLDILVSEKLLKTILFWMYSNEICNFNHADGQNVCLYFLQIFMKIYLLCPPFNQKVLKNVFVEILMTLNRTDKETSLTR